MTRLEALFHNKDYIEITRDASSKIWTVWDV